MCMSVVCSHDEGQVALVIRRGEHKLTSRNGVSQIP